MNYKHLIAKNIIAGNPNSSSNNHNTGGSSQRPNSLATHVSPHNNLHQRGLSQNNSLMLSVNQQKPKLETDNPRQAALSLNKNERANYGQNAVVPTSQASAEAAAKLYGERNQGVIKMSSGPISQRVSHGVKDFGEPARVAGMPNTGLREHKKSNRTGANSIDGVVNNANYQNVPTNGKQSIGDIQSGSMHFSKEGKGISSFGVNNNNKYIPRRSG